MKARKRNPQQSLEQVKEQFNALLLDRDPESIQIAQDLVEESGTTLASLSEKETPHRLASLGVPRWGEFRLHHGIVVRWQIESNTETVWKKETGSPTRGLLTKVPVFYPFVYVHFGSDSGDPEAPIHADHFDWEYRAAMENDPMIGGGERRFQSQKNAVSHAVEHAWYAVKIIAQRGIETREQWRRDIQTSFPSPGPNTIKTASHIVNPCSSPVQNPAPWVVKHLAESWTALEDQIPAKWLPKLDRTRNKGSKLVAEIPEYGCGAYGCVFPTNDPNIVMKLTTDTTEAEFAAYLAAQLPVPIVTHYEVTLHLPSAEHQGRKVYLLWRQAADDVGNVDKVVGAHAEDAIGIQHAAAQAAYSKLHDGEDATAELKTWERAVDDMGRIPELSFLADGLLQAYRRKGIFFGDIHGGNLGLAGGRWVITDPGHVAVIDSRRATVPGRKKNPGETESDETVMMVSDIADRVLPPEWGATTYPVDAGFEWGPRSTLPIAIVDLDSVTSTQVSSVRPFLPDAFDALTDQLDAEWPFKGMVWDWDYVRGPWGPLQPQGSERANLAMFVWRRRRNRGE